MQTQKLYYQDSHLFEFSAQVISCEESKHGFEVVLDQTAFYPEGGGQPGDTGYLNDVRVTDTHEKAGVIFHYCKQPLQSGQTVHGRIDVQRRLEFMQLHSGEHIVSGLIHEAFGYDNVGFHMGADMVTIDFSGMLSQEDLKQIEAKANEIVWKNLPVQISWPDEQALKTIPYRSKKELSGEVRIVTIPTADICACCGTHVKHTGEIGLIKIFSCVKFHEGVRLEMLCGARAYEQVCKMLEQNHESAVMLSAKPTETAAGVRRVLDELGALKYRAARLEEQVFQAKASALAGTGDCVIFEPMLSSDGVRKLADAVLDSCGAMAAVFSGSDQDGYKYAIGCANRDLRPFVKKLNQRLNGRGGGREHFVQGSVQATKEQIEAFMKEEHE